MWYNKPHWTDGAKLFVWDARFFSSLEWYAIYGGLWYHLHLYFYIGCIFNWMIGTSQDYKSGQNT